MAKKTRTELSTLAVNTNLPDNTSEQITPTTERAQLTEERDSVINYKDDLGGSSNAGKFLTVGADGESLTMVDEPSGVPDWVTFATAFNNLMMLKSGTTSAQIRYIHSDGTTLGATISYNQSAQTLLLSNSGSGNSEAVQIGGGVLLQTGGFTRLEVDNNGNVIVNSGLLEINSMSTTTGNTEIDKILFKKSHPAGLGTYTLGEIRSKTDGGFTGGLNFYTNKHTGSGNYASTFAMTIDDNQNVGIQTDSPLTINGNAAAGSGLHVNASSGFGVLALDGADGSQMFFNDQGASANSRLWRLLNNNGSFSINAMNDDISVKSSALTISSGGQIGMNVAPASTRTLLVKGQGTSSSTAGFQVNDGNNADILVIKDDKSAIFSGLVTFSNGIQFGTGSTLDAYEEGTWNTATIGGSTNFGSYSGTTAGEYVRIGDQVTVNVYFSAFTLTGSSGSLVVRSLPFNPTGGTGGYAVGNVAMHSIPFTGGIVNCILSQNGGTQIEIFQSFNNTGWLNLPTVNQGTKYLMLSITYKI